MSKKLKKTEMLQVLEPEYNLPGGVSRTRTGKGGSAWEEREDDNGKNSY